MYLEKEQGENYEYGKRTESFRMKEVKEQVGMGKGVFLLAQNQETVGKKFQKSTYHLSRAASKER